MATNKGNEIEMCTIIQFKENNSKEKGIWVMDTGATSHMSPERCEFQNYTTYDNPKFVRTANGDKVVIAGKGEITINIVHPNEEIKKITLTNVLHVPTLTKKLLSVGKLTKNGYRITFNSIGCQITGKNDIVITCKCDKKLFILDTIDMNVEHKAMEISVEKTKENTIEWTNVQQLTEPDDWNQVKELPEEERNIWINAMTEELEIIETQKEWTKTDIPMGIKPLACKWIYKIKYDDKNQIKCTRARLVAKGCQQTFGKDFDEIYAPVVRHVTIRVLLTIIAHQRLMTRHLDIRSAFLYGELKEEIFLQFPPGPWNMGKTDQGLKLHRAIYGLRQAAHAWNEKINQTLINFGLTPGIYDPCLYTMNQDQMMIYVLIHVDDLLMASNDQTMMNKLNDHLEKEYKTKNLGPVRCYLGMNITINYEEKSACIHQIDKIKKVVKKLNMNKYELSDIPMSPDFVRLKKSDKGKLLENNILFQQLIGFLLYLGLVSRPDVLLATNILGRMVANPTTTDWKELKRVIKYLNLSSEFQLQLNTNLKSYSDADWAGDQFDRKSTSGHVHFMGNSLVNWGSKKQTSVALSTSEAEYVALSLAVIECIWTDNIMRDLGIFNSKPLKLFCDNISTIHIIHNEGISARTKHIDIKIGHIKDEIKKGAIQVVYCPTDHMTADMFTKPLPKQLFNKFISDIGIVNSIRKEENIKREKTLDADV